MSTDDKDWEKKLHLSGWILFLVCALLFIASGLSNGDLMSLVGSFIFLAGCVVFIIPLLAKRKRGKDR
ncbi:MAG: hypothetical protein QF906_00780 [Dehalococcoidales bacterium]|jgi:uncharacterized membrane protein YhhN|nr:hypothetical protein [Dehalococcoidales bacterium]MDP7285707.1 hypothetical protein [Dehalococcoidales bacterium]MDP7415374.1 hypothetical protein [Dehalococcoidales bacterium]